MYLVLAPEWVDALSPRISVEFAHCHGTLTVAPYDWPPVLHGSIVDNLDFRELVHTCRELIPCYTGLHAVRYVPFQMLAHERQRVNLLNCTLM